MFSKYMGKSALLFNCGYETRARVNPGQEHTSAPPSFQAKICPDPINMASGIRG